MYFVLTFSQKTLGVNISFANRYTTRELKFSYHAVVNGVTVLNKVSSKDDLS